MCDSMQSIEEESIEVRNLKQSIITQYPYSGANLKTESGKNKDVIFLMKSPGYDAYLFEDGSVTRRFGFGSKKVLRRYGSFNTAYYKLLEEGYVPYGIFRPGLREQYEQRHKEAEERILRSRQTFPPAPELKKNRNINPEISYIPDNIQKPVYKEQSSNVSLLQQMNQMARMINDEATLTPNLMGIEDYNKWVNKMYNVVLNRRKPVFKDLMQEKKQKKKRRVKDKDGEEL